MNSMFANFIKTFEHRDYGLTPDEKDLVFDEKMKEPAKKWANCWQALEPSHGVKPTFRREQVPPGVIIQNSIHYPSKDMALTKAPVELHGENADKVWKFIKAEPVES